MPEGLENDAGDRHVYTFETEDSQVVSPPPQVIERGLVKCMDCGYRNDCSDSRISPLREPIQDYRTCSSDADRGRPAPKNKVVNESDHTRGGSGDGDRNPLFSAEKVKGTVAPQIVGPLEIFRYADAADRLLMVVGILFAVGFGAAMPVLALLFGRISLDLLSDPSSVEKNVANTSLIMIYVGIGVLICGGGHVLCWTLSASRQVARIRLLFFHAVLRQDIGWHDQHSPGELTARMAGDTRVIYNGINDKLSQGIVNASMGIIGYIVGFVSCWELTFVMIGIMPFIIIMAAIIGNIVSRMTESSRKRFASAGSLATEVIENIRTVQIFGRENYEVQRFAKAVLKAQDRGIRKEFAVSLSAAVIMALMFVSYTVAFFFGSYLVEWGRRDVEAIISAFFSVLLGSFGFGFVAPSATAFTESRVAAYEIFKAIDRVPPVDIDADGIPVTGFNQCIEFRNVCFAYPTRLDMVLFRDLNLTIKCGQKVAFSGASGCGKSSMIGLIQRFYDPVCGAVLCDNVDLRELCLRDWRDRIGIVSQEPKLFAGTMMENVRVGKPVATEEEVIEACKRANIHDTIMALPDQYNTSVGAVGSQLSGGQRQRIAIARALVKRPSILLLDEATSALDQKSEMEVQRALNELMQMGGMTVIVIAHRLATIRNVDCIYYVKYDGAKGSRITESGSFDELIALGGEFAAVAKMQGVSFSGTRSPTKRQDGSNAKERLDVVPDEAMLAQLDDEALCAASQRVPIEELAKWEVNHAKVSFWRFMAMGRDMTWAVALGILGSAVGGATRPASTILTGYMMKVLGNYTFDGNVEALRSGTNLYASLFLVFALASFLGWILHGFYGYAGSHLTTKISILLFRQILRQDMNFFDIPGRDAGTLSGMLSGDCEAVRQLWGPSIGLKVQMLCAVASGIVVGFIYQWKVALVALAFMPLVIAFNLAENVMMDGYTRSNERDTDDMIVTEALSNVRTVTSFNMKEDRVEAFKKTLREEMPRNVKKGIIAGSVYGITQFLMYSVYALCFWYGSKLISRGEADLKDVMIASMSVLSGAQNAGEAGAFATKLADAERSAKRIFSIIDRVPDVDIEKAGDKDLGESCDIEFKNVRFIYAARPKQVVLTSADMRFGAGTSNGLMGQTGCGKSTIVQMLARFYERRSGLISVNGKDLSSLDISEWRRNISIVLQEPNLFSGTVRENIRYARAGATDEEVEEAAQLAHIHADIMTWPEGYDTDVGYKGSALSGGQKQRVAIARGLLRRPKLLLLDEATSALDNVTEAKVQKSIDAYLRDKKITSISIAHRLTTIRHCDQIVLLDSGHIIEQGTHEELMALRGEYRTLHNLYMGVSS
ncbi:hypothetical protein JKF63_01696 [Porcisia hertigi]|uniref:Uncharacterized protein n=1 Tax=Porcisia hertigi TaxID=2761500 RepID=A0A836L0L9_9TRYP|nr:hypothetical protein JKF63_01696 [Porcisia hertigi]